MKTAVITGGTSGIGLASAKICLEQGCRVIAVARSADKFRRVRLSLGQSRENYCFVQADLQKHDECKRAAGKIEVISSGIDVLINSAGIYLEKAVKNVTEEDFDLVMNTNVKGTYFMCKYLLPLLHRSSAPSIVNVSSDAGINGNYFCSAYCASKGAVTLLTKALALELAGSGIRVNCVCPGDIDTPMTQKQLGKNEAAAREMASVYPLGRIGTAQEAAEVICFLASEKAAFVTGAAWTVDGGLTSC